MSESALEQNVWTYAYEEIKSQSLLSKNKGLEEEIEAHAREHADERLRQWRARRSSDGVGFDARGGTGVLGRRDDDHEEVAEADAGVETSDGVHDAGD